MKLIDIHTHGGYGVNFNTSSSEEIKLFLRKLKQRGIVALCPTLVGDSISNLRERFKLFCNLKKEHKEDESYIIGLHLEGTFLNPNKPGIQDDKVFMQPNIDNFKNLAGDYENIIKIVTLAPELDKDSELTKYLESKNIRAHAGHTLASNIGLASATTHHFNAMEKLSHRGENLTLDALLNDNIYCEIIADGIHVSKNMLKLFFKVKDKTKIIMISDSLPAAHLDKEIIFCNKKILPSGKDSNGTIAGSVMFLDEIADYVAKNNIATAEEINNFVFKNPLEHLNLDKNELKYIENLAWIGYC